MGSLRKSLSLGLPALCILLMGACREKPVTEKFHPITNLSNNFESPGTWMQKTGDAPEGKAYTHIENEQPYSAGVIYPIPDSLVNKDIRVIVSCYIRKGCRDGAHSLVISVQGQDATLYWETFEADRYVYASDEWVLLKDSLQIPSFTNNRTGMELRAFGWSPRGVCYFDMDELRLELKQVDQLQANGK
jgi:hypothetical protein